MGCAEDIIKQVCRLTSINPNAELTSVPSDFRDIFSVIVTLDRSCRKQNPVVVDTEVSALISENCHDTDTVIHTDGSVVCHQQCLDIHRTLWWQRNSVVPI